MTGVVWALFVKHLRTEGSSLISSFEFSPRVLDNTTRPSMPAIIPIIHDTLNHIHATDVSMM